MLNRLSSVEEPFSIKDKLASHIPDSLGINYFPGDVVFFTPLSKSVQFRFICKKNGIQKLYLILSYLF